jgi:hypothetical protein
VLGSIFSIKITNHQDINNIATYQHHWRHNSPLKQIPNGHP